VGSATPDAPGPPISGTRDIPSSVVMAGSLSTLEGLCSSPRIAATISVATCVVVQQILRLWRQRGTPPGAMGLPLGLGETIIYAAGPAEFIKRRVQRYGGIFKTHLLFEPFIILTGEEAVKWFFRTFKEVGWPSTWNQLMGRTLTTVNGEVHRFQRSMISQAFTDTALASYLPQIEQFTDEHLRRCAQMSAAGPFDPCREIKDYTYAVAQNVALGDVQASDAPALFATWLDAFGGLIPFNQPWTAFGKAMRARAQLLGHFRVKVEEKRRQRESGGDATSASDVLSNVLNAEENGTKLTDEEILDFLLVLLFAGHDTTLATIQNMLAVLGRKPELASELAAEVAGAWDGKSSLSYEFCTTSAPKCRRFIQETLRAIPPVALIMRVIPEDMEYRGYRLPAGWRVGVSMAYEQHDEAAGFNGEGFDMGRIDSVSASANFPFGQGARRCIGYKLAELELCVWLVHFLSKYDLTVKEKGFNRFPFHSAKVEVTFRAKV